MQNLFFLMLHMKTTVKFLFSTLVAAAAMTSTAWAEGTAGKIAIGEVEYDSFQEVIDVVTSSESISSVKLQGDITEVLASDKEFIINGDLTITADSASKISLSNSGTNYDLILNGNSSNDVREKLTIDENVALEVADRIVWAGYYGNNVDIQVDGALRGVQLWIGADVTVGNTGKLESFGEAFVLRRGATVDVEGKAAQGASETERTCQIRANYFNLLSGYVNVKNTLVEGGALWIANTGSYTNEGSVWISMDNTVWKSTGNLKMNTDATALIEVDNGSVLTVGLHDGQGSSIGKNSDLWISDASILNTNKITVEGCVDLYDATWNAVGTVTNNAVIDVRQGSLLNASQTSIVNNASGVITVESSTLRAGSFVNNGTVYVEGDGVTSWDSNVTGTGAIYVGWDHITGKDNLGSTLKIVGDKSISGSKFYVDDGAVLKIEEGNSLSFSATSGGDNYKFLVVGGNLDVAGDLTVDGCSIRFSRAKSTKISGTANFDGQTCVYGSNVTVTGELNITHGENMADSLIIGYSNASAIGNIDTTANLVVSGANAKVTVNGGAWKPAAVTKIYTDENGKLGSLIVEAGATFETDGSVENGGIVKIDNDGSSFSAAGTIVNNYYLLVQNGACLSAGKIVNNNSFDIYNSTLENQTVSGSGYVYAENALLNNISVSGNTVYMMGTNVNGGTFATVYNGYGVVNGEWQTAGDTESVISGNVVAGSWYDYGKTTVASGATVTATNFYAQGTNGATIDGTVEVSGIFRGYNGTISESGKVVAGTAVHLYGNTINQREYNIKGELIASNDGNHASVFEVGSAYVKQYYGDNGEYWSIGGANTVVNVSGSVTLKAGEYGAANARVNVDEEGYKATLNITDGGSVVVEGTLTNNGFINVDGGTLTAVTIVNNGSITLNNATFNVTNLTGTGTLTMLGKSEVKDESGSAGVEVESIVVKTESNAVALSSSVNTIVFGGVQEVTETANTEITTLAANESVVIAWHFDVSGIESGESVTIETTIKTGLNDSEIKIFHKGDEVGAEWTEADVSDVNYDATTGKLSFKANSFSSYAVAVPEPSMFGLFAGLGALLLVGTRRRRR